MDGHACASTPAAGATTPPRASSRGSGSTPRSSTRRSGAGRSRRSCTRAATRRAPAAASSPSDRRLRPARHERARREGPPGGARARADRARRQAVRALAAAALARPRRSGPATSSPRSRAPSASAATFRLGPVDLDLAPGERVAVTGRNGSGKSTLLALLLGELPLAAGRRASAGRPCSARSTSAGRRTTATAPLLAAFAAATGLPPGEARTLLAKFELGADHVERPCATLSPGERTRAAARRAAGARRQLPRARRADEPPRPGGDRGAGDGARGLRGHARRRLARPPLPGGRRADEVARQLVSYTPQPLMAVPKKKTSKARRDKRRAQHGIEAPRVNMCPTCHQPKRPHHVCPTCKTYRGREIEPLRTPAP